MTKATTAAKKTYLLETRGGSQRKLTVPAAWKVTFGPTTPYEKKDGYHGKDHVWALRLYEGTKLRGIFTDVKSFRDMDIAIIEKRIRTKRQVMEKASKSGGKAVVAEARIEEWVDPDDPACDTPSEDYLRLEHKADEGDLEF